MLGKTYHNSKLLFYFRNAFKRKYMVNEGGGIDLNATRLARQAAPQPSACGVQKCYRSIFAIKKSPQAGAF